MKAKKIIILTILSLILLGAFRLYILEVTDVMITNKLEDKILPDDMKQDLDYVVKVLAEVHPSTYNGFTMEQESIIERAYESIKTPMKIEEFYFIVNEILTSMGDGHTSMHFQNAIDDQGINVNIVWLDNGMYISEDTDLVKKGDRIISIGNKDEATILNKLEKIIPAENIYWGEVSRCDDIT